VASVPGWDSSVPTEFRWAVSASRPPPPLSLSWRDFVSLVYTIRMHPLFKKADELSHLAIGAAIEVHRLKGPALTESIHERCLMRELDLRKIAAVNQRLVKIEYKGLVFEEPLRFDVLAEDCLLLELNIRKRSQRRCSPSIYVAI